MQFGVLAQVLFLGGLVMAWTRFCEIDGKLLGGMQFGVLAQVLFLVFGALFDVLVTVRAHLCKIECRVLGGMQFSVLQVLFWGA